MGRIIDASSNCLLSQSLPGGQIYQSLELRQWGLTAVMQSSVSCRLQGVTSPEQHCPARTSRMHCSTKITSVRSAAVHRLQMPIGGPGWESGASKEALCRYSSLHGLWFLESTGDHACCKGLFWVDRELEAHRSLRVSIVSCLRRGRQTRAVGALAPSPSLSDSELECPCTAAPFSWGGARPTLPEVSCCSGWRCPAPGHAPAVSQHACLGQGLRHTHKSRSHADMQHCTAQGMDSLPKISLGCPIHWNNKHPSCWHSLGTTLCIPCSKWSPQQDG